MCVLSRVYVDLCVFMCLQKLVFRVADDESATFEEFASMVKVRTCDV